jgi:hypothetical protein
MWRSDQVVVARRGEGEYRAGCVRKLVRFVGHDEAPESRPDHRALLPGRAPPAEPGRGGGTQLVRLRARLLWKAALATPPVLPGSCPKSDNISLETSSGARLKCSVLEALRSARMGSISFLRVMKIVRAELAFEKFVSGQQATSIPATVASSIVPFADGCHKHDGHRAGQRSDLGAGRAWARIWALTDPPRHIARGE